MSDKAGRMHGYIEVTIAAALMTPEGALNDDMADVTLAFGLPTTQPPRPLSEAEVTETLRVNLGRVAAMIEAVFLANGAMHLGQVDQPMTEHSREVGTALSDSVKVRLYPRPEGAA